MTMYAKNFPTPPKFKYPYQKQQRQSGSFVVTSETEGMTKLPVETVRAIEESAKKIEVTDS